MAVATAPVVLPDMQTTLRRLVGLELSAIGGFDLSDGIFLRQVNSLQSSTLEVLEVKFQTNIGAVKVSFSDLPKGFARLWREWLDSLGKEVATAVSDKLCSAVQNGGLLELQPTIVGSDSGATMPVFFNVTGAPGVESIGMQVDVERLRVNALQRLRPARSGKSICLRFWLHFGQTHVAVSQLGQIEVGGCFVLEQKLSNAVVSGCLSNSIQRYQPFARVQWNLNEGCVILDENYPAESAPDFTEQSRDIASLTVPVFAFVELTSVSIEALVGAVPGTILLSDLDAANIKIKLSANGTVFGEGQLVQIDDRVAVKVTGLAK